MIYPRFIVAACGVFAVLALTPTVQAAGEQPTQEQPASRTPMSAVAPPAAQTPASAPGPTAPPMQAGQGQAGRIGPHGPAEPTTAVAGKGAEKTQEKPASAQRPAPPIAQMASAPVRRACVPCSCSPAKPPVYIEDWERLAALTRSDELVFQQAHTWADREDDADMIREAGGFFGIAVAALGTVDGLKSRTWGDDKWAVAGGLTGAAVSWAVAWLISPHRDDLLTVINQWNPRHPDLALAP